MQEEFNRLKKKKLSNEAFEAYLNNPNVKRLYNENQLTELKAIWYGEEVMDQEKEVLEALAEEKPYSSMNKDELDEYANSVHGIDLDKRFKKEAMIEELKEELKKQNEE
jgi:hypothetical protein